MKRLILAFQLLTRLPIRRQIDADARDYAGAAAFYPLAGLAVGIISALAYSFGGLIAPTDGVFMSYGIVSSGVSALFAVIAMVAVTGGLHLDGLADSFDGLLSSRSPERMLEIMKDSRMGVMGAIALILDIAARLILVSALEYYPRPTVFLALIVAPCAAKVGVVAAASVSPYARKDGLGKSVTEHTRFGTVLANVLIALVCCALVTVGIILAESRSSNSNVLYFFPPPSLVPEPFFVAPALVLLIGVIISKLVTKKLGGITGDILGMANEIAELSVMLLILAWR